MGGGATHSDSASGTCYARACEPLESIVPIRRFPCGGMGCVQGIAQLRAGLRSTQPVLHTCDEELRLNRLGASATSRWLLMSRYVLRPAIEVRKPLLIVDRARGSAYAVSRQQWAFFRRLISFLRTPRSRRQIHAFIVAQGFDVDNAWFKTIVAPLVIPVDGVRGSRGSELYERVVPMMPARDFIFMNHGYASLGAKQDEFRWLAEEDLRQRYHIGLVHHLFRGLSLTGKSILDVGCGRGGTCSYLARYHSPKRIYGLDFSANNIAFCSEHHRHPGLCFVQGDAHALPFGRSIFSVVSNVESSHCYYSIPIFFGEVWRVLRRGGHFCYTDCMPRGADRERSTWLAEVGFEIVSRQDISKNVARAIRLNADSLAASYGAMIRRDARNKAFIEGVVAGINGTFLEDYSSGRTSYVTWQLRKPEIKTKRVRHGWQSKRFCRR